MKTKFDVSDSIFGTVGIEKCFDYYNKHYKERGFIFDKENQEVYKIFNKEIHLKEGDRIFLESFRIVTWKCIHIEEDMIEYIVNEE